MLIYNVTTKLQWDIHDQWLEWMRTVHIPEVMATGAFVKSSLLRLLEIDDTEGPTYAVQYHAFHRSDYDRYIRESAPALREKTIRKWGDKIIAFRTLMELVQ